MTIYQVNREALASKLANMGIYPAAMFLENHATVAVEEFLALHGNGGEPEITATGFEVSGETKTDVDCICPQCGQKFTMDGVSVDVSLDVEESDIEDAVEIVGTSDVRPGMLVLDPSEVALILMDWAKANG